jgi:translation initiation factor IF-3
LRRRQPFRKFEPVNKYRINRQIRVPQVRLVDAENEQVGVVSADDARKMADEAGLDLVEVQPNAEPPVCRIMDYGKFKYAQKKKERGQSKAKVHSTLKELRVRPAIDEHDLQYRLVQGRKFLEEGHKVQVVCIFRGRQRAHPQLGFNVMKKVTEVLADISKVESPPRMTGPRLTMMLSRKSGGHASSPAKKPGGKPKSGGTAPKAEGAQPDAARAPDAKAPDAKSSAPDAGKAPPERPPAS